LFTLGGKQSAIVHTKLSSISKRTLSTSDDSNEHPNKKRKITDVSNNCLRLAQCLNQV